VTFRLLCFTLLLAGCGAHVRDAIVRSPEPNTASWTEGSSEAARADDPFTGSGSGVRRIDAVLP
jgi:hypothetical protein